MKKRSLIILGLLLFAGIGLAGISLTNTVFVEPESKIEPTDPTTISKIEDDLKTKIEAVPEVKAYYTDKKELEEATKTMVEEFKGTNVVFIHTYYPNGTHAVTVSTKQAIELKEEVKPIDTKT